MAIINKGCIAVRWIVAILTSVAAFLGTVMLSNFNIAILAMVNQTDVSSSLVGSDECKIDQLRDNETETKATERQTGEYNWDPYTQGILLGAFNYGYIGTQLFGGLWSEKYGAKWVIGGGLVLSAIFSSLTPLAADLGAAYLFAVLVSLGMAEGLILPGTYALVSEWMPLEERPLTILIMTVGTIMGNCFGSIVTGFLCASTFMGGWPASFYIPSIAVGLLMVPWKFLVYSSPEEHPSISKDEHFFIRSLQGTLLKERRKQKIPWCYIISSGSFWALVLVRIVHYWFMFTSGKAVPIYMETTLGLSVTENGIVNGILYSVAIIGCAFGVCSNAVKRKTNWSVTFVRKLYCTIAYGGCALCWICIPYAGCNTALAVMLLFAAKFFYAFSYSGDSLVMVDMAPQYAGTLYGATSSIGGICGFLSPMLTGYITQNNVSVSQWSYVFDTTAAICIIGLFCFLLWGSAEVQPWATTDEKHKMTSKDSYSDYGSMNMSNDIENPSEMMD